jgi:putative ABC transport system permease protein
MNEIFGIPAGTLATVLAVLLAAGLLAVAVLAVRNRIFVKLALRNVPRRRGRSALIVTGLMLGTAIIAAALATGDTMSHTIRSSVIASLGQTDELVSVKGTDVESVAIGDSTQVAYFNEAIATAVTDIALSSPLVDGVAPAIVESVAVQDLTSRQNEPRVTLFASDPAALASFGEIRTGGEAVTLAQLGDSEVYLNADAAEELDAAAGDRLQLLVGGQTTPFTVRSVVRFDGAGSDGPAVLAPLATAQRLLGIPGLVEHLLISNRGDAVSGAALSDDVVRWLQPVATGFGLDVDAEKQDGLERADAEGNAFMTLFTTFGTFSIAAGVLLIFLIFVMLAAERRGELGIARAIGTRRGHLVQLFLFEGLAYDLLAALVGIVLGIGVAYGMVLLMAQALGAFGVDILYHVTPRSIVVGYALGVLLTFVVVAVSAWRVSVLTIATAVRNLPEPPRRRTRRRWLGGTLALLLGGLLVFAGIQGATALPFLLGLSLGILGVARLAALLGAPDRLSYTAGGLALMVVWLLPFDSWDVITDFSMDMSVFLVGGLLLVVGATWTVMYNAPVLLGAMRWSLGRVRALAPVVRLAVAYPLRSLFRTGVTLAMFTLVVFTLVVGTTISGSFTNAMNDLDLFGGGFDVRAVAAPASPVRDVGRTLPRAAGAAGSEIRVAAGQAIVPLEARQVGTGRAFESYAVTGLDDAFLQTTTYGFSAIADGYDSADDVWRALREQPGLAIVDPFVAPRRDNWGVGNVGPDFRLSGFYLEDGRFAPLAVDVRDPQTGQSDRLKVIGVLADTIPQLMSGLSTSSRTLAGLVGARATPTVYWLDLAPGADARTTATSLESALLAHGLDAEALEETLDDTVAANKTFNYLVEGFMALGLVVGVAALGVISARAVVERRQQIGVLRSLGFQRRMIQAVVLAESSFVALTAIVVGTLLGLAIAWNVLADTGQQAAWRTLTMDIPWLTLGLSFAVVYGVALLTTLAPAVRASRTVPAEALRYQ